MDLFWCLGQGRVILLHEIPANLLRVCLLLLRGSGGGSTLGSGWGVSRRRGSRSGELSWCVVLVHAVQAIDGSCLGRHGEKSAAEEANAVERWY